MSAWGTAAKSCDSLLTRIEADDPTLTELCILPGKNLTDSDVERLARAIHDDDDDDDDDGGTNNTHLTSIGASDHDVSPSALRTLGAAIASRCRRRARATPPDDGTGTSEAEAGGIIASLSVGSKEMGDAGIVALCSGLGDGGGGLEGVDLSYKSAKRVGFAAIGRCIGGSRALRRLDLSRNGGCGDEGAAALIGSAPREALPFRNLTYLNLADCGIGSDGVEALANGLAHGMQQRDDARSLDLVLSDNPIGEDGCSNLEPLVPILNALSLANCDIDSDGVHCLMEAIHGRDDDSYRDSDDEEGSNEEERTIVLTMLDLSRNGIYAEGADSIGRALDPEHSKSRGLPSLTELRLAGCPVATNGGDFVDGIQDLTRYLEYGDNTTLKTLDLSDTGCTSAGAAFVLRCSSLTSLRLFGNRLGSGGFDTIAPLLRGGHPSLVNLDLGGNDAGEDAVAGLLRAIMEQPPNDADADGGFEDALRVLEIGGNEVGSTVETILQELKVAKPELDVARDRPRGEMERHHQQVGL